VSQKKHYFTKFFQCVLELQHDSVSRDSDCYLCKFEKPVNHFMKLQILVTVLGCNTED